MGVAYSQDLRNLVLAGRDRGLNTKWVADLFGVSASWVRRVMQRRREAGEVSPRARGGPKVIKIDLGRLRELVDEQPDATIKELHERLSVNCTKSAVAQALRRMGLSFKKRRCMRPSRTGLMSLNVARSGSTTSQNATPNA